MSFVRLFLPRPVGATTVGPWLGLLPALVLVLGASLLFPAEAQAFCRSSTCKGAGCEKDDNGCPLGGKPLFWGGGCVGFNVSAALTRNLPADLVRGAIDRSFQSWTGLTCPAGGEASIAFSPLGDSACRASEYSEGNPNLNLILFDDDDFPYRGEDNTLAKTTVTFDANTGEILDADIEVNSAFNELTVSDKRIVYDLQSILTHEIGHFMGIAHSADPEATMNATYDTGSVSLRSLAPDDIAAICAIYPPERKVGCDPTPLGGAKSCDLAPPEEKGCSIQGAGSWGAGGLGGSVLLVSLLGARRARRARRMRLVRSVRSVRSVRRAQQAWTAKGALR